MRVHNVNKLPEEWVRSYGRGAVSRSLGAAAGSRRLYVNIDTVPPGAWSTKYHAHTVREEFFLVLRGTGTLRTSEGERAVGPGDFLAKPCGPEHAHAFYNSGAEDLVLLDAGTVERGDVCVYPDEDVCFLRDQGLAFREEDHLREWTSDPEG